MKRRVKTYLASVLAAGVITASQMMCAYGASVPMEQSAQTMERTQEYCSPHEARVTGTTRGRVISSADLAITDRRGGKVGVYAELLCHEPMSEIRIWIYLEQWDPWEEDWYTVDVKQFEWLKQDYPDTDLTMASVSYVIPDQQRGQDYRLRGIFGANNEDGSLNEAWTIRTKEILVE